jgi:hypothetical protein
MSTTHTAGGAAATAVTAATLVTTLAGAPWWLTVSLITALTVLGCVYLWTQTQIQLARLRAPTEPDPAISALRAAGRLSSTDLHDEPTRLTGAP